MSVAKIIGHVNNSSIKNWQKREKARLRQIERDKLAKHSLYRALVKAQQRD
jgi:hypothetical protein